MQLWRLKAHLHGSHHTWQHQPWQRERQGAKALTPSADSASCAKNQVVGMHCTHLCQESMHRQNGCHTSQTYPWQRSAHDRLSLKSFMSRPVPKVWHMKMWLLTFCFCPGWG